MANKKPSFNSNSRSVEINIQRRLREIRLEKEFQAKKVAKKLDIDPGYFSSLEQGKYGYPLTLQRFMDLCLIYDVDPIELFKDEYRKVDKVFHLRVERDD